MWKEIAVRYSWLWEQYRTVTCNWNKTNKQTNKKTETPNKTKQQRQKALKRSTDYSRLRTGEWSAYSTAFVTRHEKFTYCCHEGRILVVQQKQEKKCGCQWQGCQVEVLLSNRELRQTSVCLISMTNDGCFTYCCTECVILIVQGRNKTSG